MYPAQVIFDGSRHSSLRDLMMNMQGRAKLIKLQLFSKTNP